MSIKTFENFEQSFNITYEREGTDEHDDKFIPPQTYNDSNYNPFDIKDMVKLLLEKQKIFTKNNLYLVKMTKSVVSDETIKNTLIEMEGEKYNI